ncbi:MAG: MXAN_6640 family putative metalloprotease, partial [bacterium]
TLIDTAGLRKKKKVRDSVEFYSTVRSLQSIKRCDIAIVVLDATSGLESQDMRILHEALDLNKGVVLMVNKWDLLEKDTNTAKEFEKQIREKLKSVNYLPILFVSALTKKRIFKVIEVAKSVYEERGKTIKTSALNRFLADVTRRYSPPSMERREVRINYCTQVKSNPPVISFFTNAPTAIKPNYRSYLENQLRQELGFSVSLFLSFSGKSECSMNFTRIVAGLFFLTLGSGLTGSLRSQESVTQKEARQYTPEQIDQLFLQALTTMPEQKIPMQYRSALQDVESYKCATFLMAQIKKNLDQFSLDQQAVLRDLFARPQLPFSYVNSTGRFRIHYTTTGIDSVSSRDDDASGIPDYVEDVARALERAFKIEVDDLRYRQPPDDMGVDGTEYDVYILALGRGLYGETFAETEVAETGRNDFSSYIRMDNDYAQNGGYFTTGTDGARVTVAHEYLHAIQFGHRLFDNNDEIFYYELSSIWMEDIVYDDINDYYQYLVGYYERRNVPFNRFTFSNLGEALWNHYLAKKFADFDLLRRTWEIMETDVLAMEAIDLTLREKGTTFADELAEYAVWNYFTAGRADPVTYFEESAAYPEIELSADLALDTEVSVSDSNRASTFKYYRFVTTSSGGVVISGSAENPDKWRFAVIITQPGNNIDYHIFDITNGRNLGFVPSSSEIVVLAINTQVLDGDDLPSVNKTFFSYDFMLENTPVAPGSEQGISAIYPSPFMLEQHGQVVFEFMPISSERFEVQIFSADGRVVKTANLNSAGGALTASSFTWDGRDNENDLVASGIYIFELTQDGFHEFKKFAVIHE